MEVIRARFLEENGSLEDGEIPNDDHVHVKSTHLAMEESRYLYETEDLLSNEEPGLIDTHCHLDFIFQKLPRTAYSSFEDFKIKHYKEFPMSFSGCIAVFCEPSKWMKFGFEDKIMNDLDVWCTFGAHPHYAEDFDTEAFLALDELLNRDKVVALGEIGLDYSHR